MKGVGTKSADSSPSLRVQLIGESAELLDGIRSVLDGVNEPALEIVAISPEAAAKDTEVPDIAMVVFEGNEAAALGYLLKNAERSPRALIFALLVDRSRVLMRRVLHAGADELLFLPLDAADLARALMKLSERRRRAERAGGGVIYGVTSLVGGVGVSTFSANLALALRYVFGKRAAVIDLDLQNGGQNVVLHLSPEETLASLIQFTGRLDSGKLDSIKIESALTKHSSGIYVMAAPKRLEDAERVTDLTVAGVLDLMRQLFDFVVVDCGSHVDEVTVAVWERCDELFYVVDHSLVGAHCARRFRDLFERLGLRLDEPRFVLNKFDTQNPITAAAIAQSMGVECFAKIPRDDRMLEKMQLRTPDLWQLGANSALAQAFEAVARRVNARREPVAELNAGFVARIFNAFGARA